MPDTPDATVTIIAERVDGVWSLYAVPDGAHTNDDRVLLGMAPAEAGVTFPMGLVQRFWEGRR